MFVGILEAPRRPGHNYLRSFQVELAPRGRLEKMITCYSEFTFSICGGLRFSLHRPGGQ
jgi:hypothetical protein